MLSKSENLSKFYFGIPLRSFASSKDWGRVCRLFSATLNAVLNQTSPSFEVIVACHEIPETKIGDDPRVTYLVSQRKAPENVPDQMMDKHYKRRMIAAEVRRRGGGYIMAVDADDLVSRRIVEFVEKNQHPFGYIVGRGYELDLQSKSIRSAPRFDKLCGSSGIFKFASTELPPSADADSEFLSDSYGNHSKWRETSIELKRPLLDLPFPAVLYVTNSGENHSIATGNVGWRRKLVRAVTPRTTDLSKFDVEFMISQLLS